jgi:hypothetical protein
MRAGFPENSTLNRFLLGFLLGLVLPVLLFMIYFLFRFKGIPFFHFISVLYQTGKMVSVLTLAVLPNLLPFMFFVQTDRYKSGKGVIAATILFGLLILIFKLLQP